MKGRLRARSPALLLVAVCAWVLSPVPLAHACEQRHRVRGNLEAHPRLLISGSIDRADQVRWRRWRLLPSAVVEVTSGGEYVAEGLDCRGAVLASVPFTAGFYVDTAGDAVPTAIAPFQIEIPYPSGCVRVRLMREGEVLAVADPLPLLVAEAIRSVPTRAFEMDEERKRHQWLEHIASVGCSLEKRDVGEAERLLSELHRMLDSDLVEYSVDRGREPLACTKQEVLEVVATALKRLLAYRPEEERTPQR